MEVIKRNGQKEELNMEKIRKFVERVCEKQEHVEKVIESLKPQLRNGMTTKEIVRTIIQTMVEKISVEEPFWKFAAAKALLFDTYKEASINRGDGIIGYGNFYELIKRLVDEGRYNKRLLEEYTKEEIEELGKYIKPERDFLLDYMGLRHLMSRYTVRGKDNEILELPQEAFMTVAMYIALNEPKEKRVEMAKKFYDNLSRLVKTAATPTLKNARTPFPQLSSCFIDTVEDSLWGIYNTNTAFANVSKLGGGMGIYMGKIRARGSDIRGVKGAAAGIIPWARVYNDTAVAVDQLNTRKGAVTLYLDAWHADIFEFLQLKTNNGDERMKAHDVFLGVCIPDLFMKQLEKRGEWYLFDPHQVRQVMGWSLEDFYDEEENGEFTKRYWECVNHPQIEKKKVKAMEIMKAIMKSAWETGTPFIFFRDTANRMNPNKHAGMIYCSNLCTEIIQNMSTTELIEQRITNENGETIIVYKQKPGDFVVCNLSSINLGRIETLEEMEQVITTTMRFLDNVIDLNLYPVPQAEVTNKKYRAVGLGVHGYHQRLAKDKIKWESEEHLKRAEELFEWIAFFAIKASMELAKERGPYPLFYGSEWHTGKFFERRNLKTRPGGPDWDWLKEEVRKHGVRNAYMIAVAPTGSTSIIAGSTPSTDPIFAKFWIEEKKGAIIPNVVPDLNEETFWYYKEAHNIAQEWSVRAAGVRQRFIDQAGSFNLYVNPREYSGPEGTKRFFNLYVLAWKEGLKTIYYVRNQNLQVEECVSCSS